MLNDHAIGMSRADSVSERDVNLIIDTILGHNFRDEIINFH